MTTDQSFDCDPNILHPASLTERQALASTGTKTVLIKICQDYPSIRCSKKFDMAVTVTVNFTLPPLRFTKHRVATNNLD